MREIGHQVNSLLKSESRYSNVCKHFTGEKSLSIFVQNKKIRKSLLSHMNLL